MINQKPKLMRLSLSVILGFLVVNLAKSEDSRDFAMMGQASWSAFECSSLAAESKNLQEQERLFLFGYEQGQKFIAAVEAEKIQQDDLSKEVPMIMLLLLEGPSPDFMLGRIYQMAQDSALEDVYKTGGRFNSDEMKEALAENMFSKANCKLIGK